MGSVPISRFWEEEILPALVEYIRIPAKSPHFDRDWQRSGHIESAVQLARRWCEAHPLQGMRLEVVRLDGRTPLLFIEIEQSGKGSGGTVLLYGHLDKQPEMSGWREDLGPWTPKLENGRLYGRGGADDGYAVFSAFSALHALQAGKRAHARCVVVIECCEESGSYDLPPYLDALAPRIGKPDLVIGLDSGCGNYEQLWGTASLRGLVNGVLSVEVLAEGVHSGDASGVVASSFRIARALLERLEDSSTGFIRDQSFHAAIPPERTAQARLAAQVLGEQAWRKFPFVPGMKAMHADPAELLLSRSWRPMLAVTGAEGLPPRANAGNVLRPKTELMLSLRIPPTLDAQAAARRMKQILEADPPYGARVRFEAGQAATGWHAPRTSPWLEEALASGSKTHFGKDVMWLGEGGTIPFMAMLGEKFPQAQFFITGVLGPQSNAHGPNEFLHLDYAQRLTACVADVIAAHAAQEGAATRRS